MRHSLIGWTFRDAELSVARNVQRYKEATANDYHLFAFKTKDSEMASHDTARSLSELSMIPSKNLDSRSSVDSGHSGIGNDTLNAEAFERASEIENACSSLCPVTSYVTQIAGDGGGVSDEKSRNGDKNPNLVEWNGPNDPANPYNWYFHKHMAFYLRTGLKNTNGF